MIWYINDGDEEEDRDNKSCIDNSDRLGRKIYYPKMFSLRNREKRE